MSRPAILNPAAQIVGGRRVAPESVVLIRTPVAHVAWLAPAETSPTLGF
jgi:hypothetical protein